MSMVLGGKEVKLEGLAAAHGAVDRREQRVRRLILPLRVDHREIQVCAARPHSWSCGISQTSDSPSADGPAPAALLAKGKSQAYL